MTIKKEENNMKKTWKILSLLLAAVMIAGVLAACGDTSAQPAATGGETAGGAVTPGGTTAGGGTAGDTAGGTLPREETLYYSGLQFGVINNWNPLSATNNNWVFQESALGARELMFESPYMYDFMTGDILPLLAEGDYSWNADMTELSYRLKPVAKWSDGTAVTAKDVAATWSVGKELGSPLYSNFSAYIEDVVADGDLGVVVKAMKNADGNPVNTLKLLDYIVGYYVLQADWLDKVVARNSNATDALNDFADDIPYSGPYGPYFADDQKVVAIRNDDYWGQDASMWGTLPVPKYLAHALYSDNNAVTTAFKAGEIDVSQSFIANIQDLWLKDGLPISTYYDEAPYGICLTMPTAWYNMNIPVLAENPALRKAIAMAVDYDSIIASAITNQSPSFAEVPRSVMNPTAGEQALYDHDAVKELQWTGNDVESANALLDEAGIIDTDGDGWREWNGEKIALNACCPNGWNDWQAAMEIVADAGKTIGIDISTSFPEGSVYQTTLIQPDQTDCDIFVWSPEASSPSNPYMRCLQLMGLEYVGVQNNTMGNWGQYRNEEADALIKEIPNTTDEARLKEIYTELTRIYLTEVPSFSLMYRPAVFCAWYEGVWTNFPVDGVKSVDGLNHDIPPALCSEGYGVAGLYGLELIG
ncbi:MAG: ABC transporter substrate-binding protein [Oscillospiraceae bacterium]|nr:ABC transporter substrate-binding protein [Oscillospiraceae bacterium]